MKVKDLILLFLISIIVSSCMSTNKKIKVLPKYNFIVENFQKGENALTNDKYVYLQKLLKIQTWNGAQFAIEFQSDTIVNIWWTEDLENEGQTLNGNWSLEDNCFILNQVGKYSGKYRVLRYRLDYSDVLRLYTFTIILDRSLGIYGWESNELAIKLK